MDHLRAGVTKPALDTTAQWRHTAAQISEGQKITPPRGSCTNGREQPEESHGGRGGGQVIKAQSGT